MKEIQLTQGKVAIVSDEDYAELSKHKWAAYRYKKCSYAGRNEKVQGQRTTIFMHRQIMGLIPKGMCCDHIDMDGLNNQRENLRVCSVSQNLANTRQRSGLYKGVNQDTGRKSWRATMCKKYLGSFPTPEQAAQVYNAAAVAKWGEFARLNIIKSSPAKA